MRRRHRNDDSGDICPRTSDIQMLHGWERTVTVRLHVSIRSCTAIRHIGRAGHPRCRYGSPGQPGTFKTFIGAQRTAQIYRVHHHPTAFPHVPLKRHL